ncbi:MAG: protein-methionine-sulfoxide reductase catalytic subunit MsrP [Alphaproteobacteria bacterium]|nr:protein-methionine-sulfoxide reductase catalytic subunit MsrP [Alphaproteobacteria bacterium]MCB9792589.1 protein-methionine-sulfoxide reductase catalytic subunit MsrP [Alphaproteobacteria bacterium]
MSRGPHLRLPPRWALPESAATPEAAWLDRRAFIQALGLGAIGGALGCRASASPIPEAYAYSLPEHARSPRYAGGMAPAVELTPEQAAASYNNFYEFGTQKDAVWRRAATLQPVPWTLELKGLCEAPRTFDLDSLLARMPIEERVYRFRCVEAWSMVVPWVGFPLKALLEQVRPLSSARFLALTSLADKATMPGIAEQYWYPWPYHEALRMDEAMNPLTLMACGIYGHPLPNQHGAPLRLITPWKYGYKQLKCVVSIELTDKQPPTFWSSVAGDEYDFLGNVRPDIPHPRWSQATDRVIPTGERVKTPMYNGYAAEVAALY